MAYELSSKQLQCTVNHQKQKTQYFNYRRRHHTLGHVPAAKYLRLNITSDLKWTQHINCICGKTNSTIGFLKRNINISNKTIKEKAYK